MRGPFRVVHPSDDDLARAAEIPLDACPRRYCWWWPSLAFEWEIEPATGCEWLTTKKPTGWKNTDLPCVRSGAEGGVDHYEPREPHLMEDGFETTRFG